jgi:hypothetical protein
MPIQIQKTIINEIGGFGKFPLKIVKLTNDKFVKKEKTIGYVKTENEIVIKINETVTKKELEDIINKLISLR